MILLLYMYTYDWIQVKVSTARRVHSSPGGVVVVTEPLRAGAEPASQSVSQEEEEAARLEGQVTTASRSSTDARFHHTRSSRIHISPSSKISTRTSRTTVATKNPVTSVAWRSFSSWYGREIVALTTTTSHCGEAGVCSGMLRCWPWVETWKFTGYIKVSIWLQASSNITGKTSRIQNTGPVLAHWPQLRYLHYTFHFLLQIFTVVI